MDVTDLSRTVIQFETKFPEVAGGTDVVALLEGQRLVISWRNVEGNTQVVFPVSALPMVLELVTQLSAQPHVITAIGE